MSNLWKKNKGACFSGPLKQEKRDQVSCWNSADKANKNCRGAKLTKKAAPYILLTIRGYGCREQALRPDFTRLLQGINASCFLAFGIHHRSKQKEMALIGYHRQRRRGTKTKY